MNTRQKIGETLKKHWLNILLIGILGVLILVPNGKSWLLSLFLSAGLFKADVPARAPVSAAIPELRFNDVNGKSITTSDLKGKVLFINFWADWCPPCRAEMPAIDKLYNRLKDDNRFVFLMVDMDSNLQRSGNYMKKNGFSLPVVSAASGIHDTLYNGTLPTTLVIGKNSELLMKHEGIANYNHEDFVAYLYAQFAE